LDYTVTCLKKWHGQGVAWGEMAVLYVNTYQGSQLAKKLKAAGVPHSWLGTSEYKRAYDSSADKVTVVTIQSSKGLEFSRVIMVGIGQMKDDEGQEQRQQGARLLYVGMTRAQQALLVTTSGENEYSRRLIDVSAA
jgi:ATP-dependent exoDNAse (exonuclease V) beta subunit